MLNIKLSLFILIKKIIYLKLWYSLSVLNNNSKEICKWIFMSCHKVEYIYKEKADENLVS
jgi:hypothetical protein